MVVCQEGLFDSRKFTKERHTTFYNRYYPCRNSSEGIDHFLYIAILLTSMPRSTGEFLLCWKSKGLTNIWRRLGSWNTILAAIWWCIWDGKEQKTLWGSEKLNLESGRSYLTAFLWFHFGVKWKHWRYWIAITFHKKLLYG